MSRPRRAASIISSGSTPVPRLFDILRPSAASTVEWMITSVKGHLLHHLEAGPGGAGFSQSRIIFRAVELTLYPGSARSNSGVSSGQPIVANGHRADENHV